MEDLYAVLGVMPSATSTELQQAFRRMALRCHPDQNPNDQELSNQRMVAVNLAWEILRNPDSRREYDSSRSSPKMNVGGPPRQSQKSDSDQEFGKMVVVQSRMIESVGHDGKDKLFVKFRKGGRYVYHAVPISLFFELMEADSKGRFLIHNVINKPYHYERISN